MAETNASTGTGDIEWRRPPRARTQAERRWGSAGERPTFMQLFVPLVSLAVGSILVVGLIVAALVGLLTLFV